jgi:plasmid stabilization system protein ParE
MPNKIYWTRQACGDLREIRAFIARDAPITAAAFVRRLRSSVEQLRSFPKIGAVVPEMGNDEIRELIRGHYRIVYHCRAGRIDVLTVYHSSRLLDDTQF